MSFTCPRCNMTSHHPEDERQGYCGNCHDFTGRPLTVFETDTGRMLTRNAEGEWEPWVEDDPMGFVERYGPDEG